MARKFAADLHRNMSCKLSGIYSRNANAAFQLAQQYNATAFESLESILQSEVDIIYIATPHPSHLAHSLAAIEAGKAVLCEKPFTLNSRQAESVCTAAKNGKVFLMEAMWTRFLPSMRRISEIVQAGEIGEIENITTSFGYDASNDPDCWVFKKELGGGSLLDIGIYCISFTQMILKSYITKIECKAKLASSGIDLKAEWEIDFSGVKATGSCAVIEKLNNEAVIQGSKGIIRVPQFWNAKEFYLNESLINASYAGFGYQFEALEAAKCVQEGKFQSQIMPHSDTVISMEILDRIRARWGLVYEGE